jgi:hypothetical protein
MGDEYEIFCRAVTKHDIVKRKRKARQMDFHFRCWFGVSTKTLKQPFLGK